MQVPAPAGRPRSPVPHGPGGGAKRADIRAPSSTAHRRDGSRPTQPRVPRSGSCRSLRAGGPGAFGWPPPRSASPAVTARPAPARGSAAGWSLLTPRTGSCAPPAAFRLPMRRAGPAVGWSARAADARAADALRAAAPGAEPGAATRHWAERAPRPGRLPGPGARPGGRRPRPGRRSRPCGETVPAQRPAPASWQADQVWTAASLRSVAARRPVRQQRAPELSRPALLPRAAEVQRPVGTQRPVQVQHVLCWRQRRASAQVASKLRRGPAPRRPAGNVQRRAQGREVPAVTGWPAGSGWRRREASGRLGPSPETRAWCVRRPPWRLVGSPALGRGPARDDGGVRPVRYSSS